MVLADNLIEKGSIILKNLNINSRNTTTDEWTPALTGYGFYGVTYETPLAVGHYYYQRFTYKFTTTNQSPTWCKFYRQGGNSGGASISNPVANTEYTASAIVTLVVAGTYTTSFGTIYNGPSNAISGVSSYVKNVLVYDVTDLYEALRSNGVVTTDAALKTWCDNNLVHKPMHILYDVSSLVADATAKATIHKGTIVAKEYIEADGMRYYSVNSTLRDNTYFDTANPVSIYNNSGNGTVTHTRIDGAAQNSPFYPEHKYILQITTNGTASPGTGGFLAQHNAAANKIFIEKFVAKVPVGYTVNCHYNSQGTGASVSFITPRAGTGDWEEYAVLYKCGSSGSFSSGGHIALSGSNNTSVTWYLAYVNNCEITSDENLKFYSVLPDRTAFKSGYMTSRFFDCRNIIPNGIMSARETLMLPSGWSYDTTDYAGDAKCSLVQPVGAGFGIYPTSGYYTIDPTARYKISFWVKCKGDMTSFLTSIRYYTSGNVELYHINVSYCAGTKTYLDADLVSGATTVTVRSNANWTARSYSRLGFRNNTNSSFNDAGTSNGYTDSSGLVSGITGSTIINLKSAYTGSTITSGKVIVESFDGGTYPYPITKGMLPTDNTWKYVEGYFGKANTLWDGSGGYWSDIPAAATKMRLALNHYGNTGTVPIKYSDIRIEPVTSGASTRLEKKIQIEEVV